MKKFKVVVNGEPFVVEVDDMLSPAVAVPAAVQSRPVPPPPKPVAPPVAPPPPAAPVANAPAGAGTIKAPMPGNINAVHVKVGDQVKSGQALLILEAMKMENEITSPINGSVKEIRIEKGQTVNNGDVLIIIG